MQPVAIPVPAIATLVRFHVVHGPDGLHAESARGPQELAQQQQPLRRGHGSRQPIRTRESFAPDVLRPVQMDRVDAPGLSLQPLDIDFEVVRCRDSARRERGMTQVKIGIV